MAAPKGTMPPNAGKVRPKGVPNKATAKRQAEVAATGLTPLDYLLSVMRDSKRDDTERLKAATAAAPYVHPKLASVEMRAELTQVIEQPVAEPVTLEQAEATYLALCHDRPPSSVN